MPSCAWADGATYIIRVLAWGDPPYFNNFHLHSGTPSLFDIACLTYALFLFANCSVRGQLFVRQPVCCAGFVGRCGCSCVVANAVCFTRVSLMLQHVCYIQCGNASVRRGGVRQDCVHMCVGVRHCGHLPRALT